jgi:glycosyltransferase involved in cell wall biosynthesis
MKLSLITVTYNSELFLSHCIDSVLCQSYQDIEYIVVDGNSNDNTMAVIKSYHDKLSKYISEPDKGIYDAINKGIGLATGDIIGILNSDDFFADTDVVTRIVKIFLNEPSVDAIYSDLVFVDRSDSKTIKRHYSSKRFKPWMFKYGIQPAHPSFYARKEVFEQYGCYRIDFKIAGDFELLLRFLLTHSLKYRYVRDVWVKMRVGGISTSGIKSILCLNNEIVEACRVNNVYTNKVMVYSKYLFKWWGFIRK